jgi:transcriptional regulator with XRE-family HTH domain
VSDLVTRFGLAVRAARREQGLAQEQLSDAAGLDRTYVSGLERGHRNPTLVTQERIAVALRRPLHELVKAAEEMEQ